MSHTNKFAARSLNDLALEVAAEWYTSKTTEQLVDYATRRSLNIGQDGAELCDDWNTLVTEEKRREIMRVLE